MISNDSQLLSGFSLKILYPMKRFHVIILLIITATRALLFCIIWEWTILDKHMLWVLGLIPTCSLSLPPPKLRNLYSPGFQLVHSSMILKGKYHMYHQLVKLVPAICPIIQSPQSTNGKFLFVAGCCKLASSYKGHFCAHLRTWGCSGHSRVTAKDSF